jgi:hypothetical protein
MCKGWNNNFFNLVGHANRKKLLSVLLSSKMPSVIHQLSVLNRDMFSSRSVYRTYAETSLLARRPLPSTWVEHQTQSPIDGQLDFVLDSAV